MPPKSTAAQAGDWIEVHRLEHGQAPRRCMVLEVLGHPGREHYRVRWDEEHESIFFPGPDAVIVPGGPRNRGSDG